MLDYCAGGDLFFHLARARKFPEHVAQFYAASIAHALEHVHANSVVYRDVKVELELPAAMMETMMAVMV